MPPSSRISNLLSRLLCNRMQAASWSMPFLSGMMVSSFSHQSTSTHENAVVWNTTLTRTIGSSWVWWRLWTDGVATSREQIIRYSYNATIRTWSTSKHQMDFPGGRLHGPRSSLYTILLSNTWMARRTQSADHPEVLTIRYAMNMWYHSSWPP